MTDEQSPYTPMAAPVAHAPRDPADPRGTLGRGIAQFMLCAVVGTIVAVIAFYSLLATIPAISDGVGNASAILFFLMIAAPWILAIALCIRHAVQGRTRTSLGMVVGMGILFALLMLLMAACFGIVSSLR